METAANATNIIVRIPYRVIVMTPCRLFVEGAALGSVVIRRQNGGRNGRTVS
jgi:hypothetical protein